MSRNRAALRSIEYRESNHVNRQQKGTGNGRFTHRPKRGQVRSKDNVGQPFFLAPYTS